MRVNRNTRIKPTTTSMRRATLSTAAVVLAAVALIACTENPVTGDRELGLVSRSQEVSIGRNHYAPAQQMQGGPYTLDQELGAYVSRLGQRVAAESERDLPYEFTVLNSSVPNAWALPGGKIAVNRGLISELDSEAELVAVLGHEVVHAAARHGAQAMERGMLTQGALAAATIAVASSEYREYANFAVGAAQVGAQLITQKYGRDAEREADRYGMIYMDRAGYDPSAAVALQETFVRLSEDRRSNWLSGLFASHPPSAERVENNRAFARQLDAGGEIGRDQYQQATAALRRRQPGYEAAEAGREALAEGDWQTALAKGREALEVEPAEARFHALIGDAHIAADRPEQAVAAYDRALELDTGYFLHWQSRGLAHLSMDHQSAARRDLERATELLPTAKSMNALGQIELQAGRTDAAREYFSAAAGNQTPAGREASVALARLELPRQPDRYLPVRWGLDENGTLLAELRNEAPVAVTDVVLEVAVRNAEGRIGTRRVPLDGVLDSGATRRVRTGIRLPEGASRDGVAVRVIRARAAR